MVAGRELGYPLTDLDDDAGASPPIVGDIAGYPSERSTSLGAARSPWRIVLVGVAQPGCSELRDNFAGARRIELDLLDGPRCTVFVQYRGAGSRRVALLP